MNTNLNLETYKIQNINLKDYTDKELINYYFFNNNSSNIMTYQLNFYNIFLILTLICI
jgi:hypothetical protein